jgi:4-amino-4-deoxy-L-arabinose transferase-like glycosyltransferase
VRLDRRPAALEVGALAILVAAQALLFGRLVGTDTDYDEGVYLTSLDALEHGQRLGQDVFAPQPPGWYLLLRLISLAGADSVRGFHIGMVVVAILTCLAAYLLVRAIGGPVAGLTASALLTIAPPFPLYAHRVLADVPPLGLALVSFWFAWEARVRRSVGHAGAGGAVLALAAAVKPNALLALPIFLLLLLWDRSGRARAMLGAIGGAAVVAVVFVVAYRGALDDLWQSVVVYHGDARDTPAVIDKTHELVTFLNWRTPFAWLVVAGLVGSFSLLRRHRTEAVWAFWAWAAISLAFLAYYRPLHENHLLVLPVVLAVPAGLALGTLAARSRFREAAVGVLALLLVAGYVQQQRRVTLADIPEDPGLVAAAQLVQRKTSRDDVVVSDHSIVPFLAHRQVAGPLVDTARLRFETGSLTVAKVLQVLDRYDVQAVVAGRSFDEHPELMQALRRRYGAPTRIGALSVFVRASS